LALGLRGTLQAGITPWRALGSPSSCAGSFDTC
jgi:hypothetical protein